MMHDKYTRDELDKKLTEKEKKFCHEWIIDWNGSRAARSAGYSENTCAEISYENLRKPHIEQYIDFIKSDLEQESGISKLRNLKELAKIAYSGISHLHDTWIDLRDWELIKEENPAVMAAIESIDTKTEYRTLKTSEVTEVDVETKYVKVKLFSKTTAIDMINKMMGYNEPDKVQHSGSIDDLSGRSTEDLILRAQAIDKLSKKQDK